METATLALSIAAFAFSMTTAIFSFLAYTTTVGLKNSTHQISYMPVPTDDKGNYENPTGKELLKEFSEKIYPDDEHDFV
jgi:hypothetical protein